MAEKEKDYPMEFQTGKQDDGDCPTCYIFNMTNNTFSGDYIFNLDTRICLMLAYTFVFCCCFFGKKKRPLFTLYIKNVKISVIEMCKKLKFLLHTVDSRYKVVDYKIVSVIMY